MGGDHKCPVCQATFTRPQHVARHMRSHTGDRPYKCNFCGDQFARSDLLSRHVNKCHPNEKQIKVDTTSSGSGTKRGQGISRATTSKQTCDQCVQGNLACDGSNPCAKCVGRKVRCTFVKFHRQTAPTGPGHTIPIPTTATTNPRSYARPNTSTGVPSAEWSTVPVAHQNPFAFAVEGPGYHFDPFQYPSTSVYQQQQQQPQIAPHDYTYTQPYYDPDSSHSESSPTSYHHSPIDNHSRSSSITRSGEVQSAFGELSLVQESLYNGSGSAGPTLIPDAFDPVGYLTPQQQQQQQQFYPMPAATLSQHDRTSSASSSTSSSPPHPHPHTQNQNIPEILGEETPKEREMRELRDFWRVYMTTPLPTSTPHPLTSNVQTTRTRTSSLPVQPEEEDLAKYQEAVRERNVAFELSMRDNMMSRYTRGNLDPHQQNDRPSFKRIASQTLERDDIKSSRRI